jgi:hypothetical protein
MRVFEKAVQAQGRPPLRVNVAAQLPVTGGVTGPGGGVTGLDAGVVTAIVFDAAETFPAASRARIP